MAKSLLITLSLALAIFSGCGGEPVEVAEARETREVLYVDVPELNVRKAPSPDAEVLATYRLGESISVLDERDGWAEVRIGYDDSGWVPREELASEKATFNSAGEASARFVTPPNPVFSPGGATGSIYLQAAVNTDGAVTKVDVVQNTTGSEALASQNVAALQKARFYPMIINGKARPFVYDHVVEY